MLFLRIYTIIIIGLVIIAGLYDLYKNISKRRSHNLTKNDIILIILCIPILLLAICHS